MASSILQLSPRARARGLCGGAARRPPARSLARARDDSRTLSLLVRKRMHLRTRVLALTGAFAAVLFSITFGLSYRARVSQERWSRLIRVETKVIATLEELIRAQNRSEENTSELQSH